MRKTKNKNKKNTQASCSTNTSDRGTYKSKKGYGSYGAYGAYGYSRQDDEIVKAFGRKEDYRSILDMALIKDIFSVQSCSYDAYNMIDFIIKWVEDNVPEALIGVDSHENILVTKGTPEKGHYYPLVAAHTDTVHDYKEGYSLLIDKDETFLTAFNKYGPSSTGCGGDDKCGIYIALKMLKEMNTIKCFFFANEEVGCLGSSATSVKLYDDVAYILQSDRKGGTDFLKRSGGKILFSDEFESLVKPYVDKYDYDHSGHGSFTDVTVLQPRVGICVSNVASGYYNAHMDSETVVLNDLARCEHLFKDIIENLPLDKRYEFNANQAALAKSHSSSSGYDCPSCGLPTQKYEHQGVFYCDQCWEILYTDVPEYLEEELEEEEQGFPLGSFVYVDNVNLGFTQAKTYQILDCFQNVKGVVMYVLRNDKGKNVDIQAEDVSLSVR